MATPIKETPILYGEDAERFIKNARENEKPENKVPQEEYNKAMNAYNEFMKNAEI